MNLESYGPPNLHIGPLRIWVHRRQFPDSSDAWDGNWLNVTAHYVADGASVAVSGPILDTVSFATFAKQLRALHESLGGDATLESVEPNFAARVSGQGKSGRMTLRVELTADTTKQGHWFEHEIDQSYLPAVITGCATLLQRYPVRRGEQRGA